LQPQPPPWARLVKRTAAVVETVGTFMMLT